MSEIESLEDVDASPSPARTDTQTRWKSSAAVLAKIYGPMTQATADIIQLISQGWTADIIGLEIWDHPVQLSQWLSQQLLTSTDSRGGAGDCCPMYLMNSWALDWSRDSRRSMKCSVRQSDLSCNTLLHIISYYYINHYYELLRYLLLHCQYIVITHYFIHYYHVSLQNHYYVLLLYYYYIITILLLYYYYIIILF